jgi:flagellar hook-basal body complex protein FliE
MADPLGLIGGAQRGQGPLGPPGGSRINQLADDGPSFKDTLAQSIEQVNQLQAEASAAQEDLMTGARADVENVILATQKADQAFRALLAVRNKVQAAFEELKQVRM